MIMNQLQYVKNANERINNIYIYICVCEINIKFNLILIFRTKFKYNCDIIFK
jgi:hypothetical protein